MVRTHTYNPNGLWNHAAEMMMMMISVRESGHPRFRGTSVLARGPLKSKGGGKTSTHCNGDSPTAELLFRIIISFNRRRFFGAVPDWCEELAQQISDPFLTSTGKPVAELNDESESSITPNVVSILTNPHVINAPVQGDLLRRDNERFENLPGDIRASKAS